MIDSVLLVNRVTKQAQLIDQDESQFVLTEIDLGQVTAQHHTSSYYNQMGATIENTTIQTRSVSITGYVIGDTREELTQNKQALNRLVNPLQDLSIIVYNAYLLVCRPDYSVHYGKTISENNDYMCKFLIQGTCGNPLFTEIEQETISLSSTTGQPLFPLIIPQNEGIIFGKRVLEQIANLENTGDYPVGIVVTLKALGSVENPSITLVETQESIRLNKTLVQGEELVISTITGDKHVRGVLNGIESNYIQYLAYPFSWIQLQVGSNSIQYDADSGASNIQATISFSPAYMEVEK